MAEEIKKELLSNVYGYDDVKKELNRIKDWLSDKELLENEKIMLPKGILFYGVPGCGKTLLLREFANSFNCPKFIIEGENENTSKEIIDTFKKARKEEFAIIMVDEIDLLIDRSCQIERTFQQELDGINKKGQILILATTNNIRSISEALLRPGRFDRKIHIGAPDKESRKKIFENYLTNLNLPMENIDLDHVVRICNRCNGAEIKAIVNDAFLRCKKNITTKDVETSYSRITRDVYEEKSKKFKDMRVAIHEAGHTLLALMNKNNWSFYQAEFNETGGVTETHEVNESVDTIEKREQAIQIGLAGYLAERVYYGKHDVGSYQDYQKVFDMTTRLVERVCIHGVEHLIPSYGDNTDRYETPKKRAKNEKLSIKLLKDFEKKTYKILKNNQENLIKIAKTMYENGVFTYSDAVALGL